ncbi:MAG: DegT/DnrJ/EryC1/StrS family aminotransferase [Chloroflexi bacterium]|nr:DegT/DnrJ/EryC1/StrS family aminotransferase [Chloroflexota bacterium]
MSPAVEKRRVEHLAIFGGAPAFPPEAALHVGRPNLGDRERLLARINQMLDRDWLTNNGPFVQEFEARLAARLGVKHCIAMSNATVGLEIAIRAAGLRGEVIVPSFTFVATAHALQWQEITPVFCDVDPATHNLDPRRVEALITPRTSGIIGVHVWGRPCAVKALSEIAARRGLTLMFDAAHAFGCSHAGQMIGNCGLAEVFSFHATKFLNTYEGGAVATNDDDLARKIRLMKNFGFAGYDNVIYIGTNGKMSEVSAAMGLTGLECLGELIAVNRRNYQQYREALAGLPGVTFVAYPDGERHNYQYVVLEVNEALAGLSRDQLVALLHAENVLARRYFYPGVHQMEPYRSYFTHAGLLLPETERLVTRVMSLPTGVAAGPQAVAAVAGLIRLALAHAPEVRARWRAEAA